MAWRYLTHAQGTRFLGTDNQGGMSLAKNPVFHARTKHIDIRHHFIRDVISDGIVEQTYISTDNMPADALTKSLNAIKHRRCAIMMGVSSAREE
jgi:hypothetical protein